MKEVCCSWNANAKLGIRFLSRLNFTLEDLDVACPAYEHFQDCVTYLCGLTGVAGEKFVAEIVPSIPQYFEYNRTQYLVSNICLLFPCILC